jgi:hypothetical protein
VDSIVAFSRHCSVIAMQPAFSVFLPLALLYATYSSAMSPAASLAEVSAPTARIDQNSPSPVIAPFSKRARRRRPLVATRSCEIGQDPLLHARCHPEWCSERGGCYSLETSRTRCSQHSLVHFKLVPAQWADLPGLINPCRGCKCVDKIELGRPGHGNESEDIMLFGVKISKKIGRRKSDRNTPFSIDPSKKARAHS